MAISPEAEEEWKIAEHLIHEVTTKCSGAALLDCFYAKPSDTYFIGNFRPVPVDDASFDKEILQKLAPSAFGAEFKLKAEKEIGKINVDFTFNFYYRIFPSREEQMKWVVERQKEFVQPEIQHAQTIREEDSLADTTFIESFFKREEARRSNEEVLVKFRKTTGHVNGSISLTQGKGEWKIDTTDLNVKLSSEISRISEAARLDPFRMRIVDKQRKIKIPTSALNSDDSYKNFIESLTEEVGLEWSISINTQEIDSNSGEENLHVLIQFVNTSKDEVKNPNFEPFLFNPVAEFLFDGLTVIPFELELAPISFRYNRHLWGKGFNCGINKIIDPNSLLEKYSTTHVPIYRQKRYQTKDQPSAFFKDLVDNPLPQLKAILAAMVNDLDSWDKEELVYSQKFPEWHNQYKQVFQEEKAIFKNEIERFKTGLDLLEADASLLFAFQLTNQTFLNSGDHPEKAKRKDKWRLFQIVFLVTQIPGMAALDPKYIAFKDERKVVDIVYFPTGGGKTEAYLAVLIFNCFYDRLRGKKAGVTSWIRFPLRLLTVQQTQRLTDVIGNAEVVRQQFIGRNEGLKGTPFGVGYFVGGGSTPNELSPAPYYNEQNWAIAKDPERRAQWKRVISCPSCKTTNITVEFDPAQVRLFHKCNEPHCKFPNGHLPLYVIDEEIYRYLPTVIVGTIDKLANIGLKGNLAMVLGKVDGYCETHGYFNGNCCRFDCKNEKLLKRKKIPGLSGPTLFIQDELHLLKEGLGTFDGHYETFTQYILKQFNGDIDLKIIASSATIEEYKRQVYHLYGRSEARMFPGQGPTFKESFYARTFEHPQRIFVGILPHNKTIFNSILEIVETYHLSINDLKGCPVGVSNLYGGAYSTHSPEYLKILDKYRTSLTYFLAGRELDSIKTDIEHYINPKFEKIGVKPLTVKELTGGISTDEVTNTLRLLEQSHTLLQPEEAILATSMISHGVDIERINSMIFYGMPRQNAEYIQSSSRVGRQHVGIVFNCLHPIRERDQSHFAYFEKYHEFLGLLVEPVAINRWSTHSIDRTMPGLFMAALIQIIANRSGNKDLWKYEQLDFLGKLFSSGQLDQNAFEEILRAGYNTNPAIEPRDKIFEEKINDRLTKYLDRIKRKGTIYKKVKEVLSPAPMTSLRDVDESISIVLSEEGRSWLKEKLNKNE